MARVELKFGNMSLRTVDLTLEQTVIGRGPEADLQIDDGIVSRLHCTLFDTGDGHRLEDLDSSSGTFVDGAKVTERLLVDGDLIVLGRHTLRYSKSPPDIARSHASLGDAKTHPAVPSDGEEATRRREAQAMLETQMATPVQVSRMRDALEARQTPRIGWVVDDGPRSFMLPNGRGTFVVGFGRGMDARLPGPDLKPREVFMIVAYGPKAEVVALSDKDEVRVGGRRVAGRCALNFGEAVEAAGVEFRYLVGDNRPPIG